jgi:hypothetical protein
MILVNLTPHEINVITPSGVVNVPPSGDVARVAMYSRSVDPLKIEHPDNDRFVDIPVRVSTPGEVTGLPNPSHAKEFLVSGQVRAALPMRLDIYSPGPLVRNGAGQPIGCEGLEANS